MIPAPPDSLLGMLQRGRGAGFLAALRAPREEARAALLTCILEDPRRDPQVDGGADWYAELAEALSLDAESITAHTAVLDKASHAGRLAREALGALTARGEPPLEEVPGLLLDLAPRIIASAKSRPVSRPEIADLHARALRGENVLEALAGVLSPPQTRYLEWKPLQEAALAHETRISLPWARAHREGPEGRRKRLAVAILEQHAEAEDLPWFEAGVIDGFRAGSEEPCPCGAIEVIARLRGAAARPLLERVFRETMDTMARARAAELLAELPGGLPPDLAKECLWDAQICVLVAGIPRAPLDLPGVRERLAALAAHPDREIADAAAARGRAAE